MYAFIVNNLWLQHPNMTYAQFLRVVGTPSVVKDPNDVNIFNEASGFYVKVESSWGLRYISELNTLSSALESLSLT